MSSKSNRLEKDNCSLGRAIKAYFDSLRFEWEKQQKRFSNWSAWWLSLVALNL